MSQSTSAEDRELINLAREFLDSYYRDDIATLAQKYPSEQKSLLVDFMDVVRFDPDFADDLVAQPERVKPYFDIALQEYQLPIDIQLTEAEVRFAGMIDESTYAVDELRADQRQNLLQVEGQVAKLSEIEPRIVEADFECQRCSTHTTIPQDTNRFQEPHECQGCERQGPFRIDYNESEFVDRQLVRIQQPPEQTKGGQGDTIDVVLEGDIVDSAEGGDRVTTTAVYEFEQKDDDSVTFDTYLNGHNVTVEETDYDEINVDEYLDDIEELASKDDPAAILADAVAPDIYGYDQIKMAVTLQLFSGSRNTSPTGSTDRGDFHVLLIGDPGCGKSTILEAASDIAPRSTMASGKGASKSGLTAAAVRDDFGDTEWSLEAGALVMADKGLCCVDEIDKVGEETTAALHTALEAQKLRVNKAGINATLPSRTSLLAAGNPKFGRFDEYEPIAEQIDIGPTLLSRFDLIFTVVDDPDAEKDFNVAAHSIEGRREKNAYTHGHATADDLSTIDTDVSKELFRAYIAHARQNYHPKMSDDGKEEICRRYVNFRETASDDDSPIPVTPRWIDAFQRLAEANARARLSDTVEEQDIERAATLLERSMKDAGMDPETGELDADMIETGTSKSQRDRIKEMKKLVAGIEQEYARGAPHEFVIERAEENGIDPAKAEHEIEKLMDQGELYQPSAEHYRTTD